MILEEGSKFKEVKPNMVENSYFRVEEDKK